MEGEVSVGLDLARVVPRDYLLISSWDRGCLKLAITQGSTGSLESAWSPDETDTAASEHLQGFW